MDAAAEIIRSELRLILPDRPHQLARNTEWVVTDRGPRDPYSADEFYNQRLQYMTFSSEGDRGIIFTRSYDDLRPDPKPMPTIVNNLAKTGATKKRSLKEYMNKKESAATSPDLTPASTPRKDVTASAPVTPAPDRLRPPPTDLTSGKLKATGTPDVRDSAKRCNPPSPPATIISSHANSPSLPLKPAPGLPPKPPTPDDSRKRRAADDGPREAKRARPSDVEPLRSDRARDEPSKNDRVKDHREKEDRARNARLQDDHAREEPARRKTHEPTVLRDTNGPKEKEKDKDRDREKSGRDQASALPNGRAALKAATTSRSDSPPRARGNSVNGLTNGSGSARGNSATVEAQKSSNKVPKLLSPLRLSFEENETAASDTNRPEKRRRPADDVAPPKTKAPRTTEQEPTPKRARIPELLSPTLPPVLEAELERIEKNSQKQGECRPREKEKDKDDDRDRDRTKDRTNDASTVAKKPTDGGNTTKEKTSLIVKLRVPKSHRARFGYLMKITSGRGVAQRAEKRPANSGEAGSDALKRPRASSIASKAPPPPSTPSKRAAPAMSRVSSNNSMAHTPGDTPIAATPTVPGSGDRNNQPELRERDRDRIALLKEKELEFKNLGRSLKHRSDAILRPLRDQSATNGAHKSSPSEVKLAWAQLLESLLCFVSSFHCADTQRVVLNKSRDHGSWFSIGPLASTLDLELRQSKSQRDAPMVALKAVLQMLANDQYLAAIVSQSDPSSDNMSKVIRSERQRTGLLNQVRKANAAIDDNSLRVTVTPWALEDTVSDMLRVMKRWCADEAVKWTPDLNLKNCGLKE